MAEAKNYITFNGKNLADFGVVLSGAGTHSAPQRDISMVAVPGRNGAISFDNGAFKNVTVTYHVGVRRPTSKNLENLRNYLLSLKGYQRMEDTYHPYEYREGVFVGGFDPEVTVKGLIAEVDLQFDCKPQRFLKSGEEEIEITSSGTKIFNRTPMIAKPLVRVYGTGTVSIGSQTITISSANSYTDIDCDIMDAFKGSVNCNGNIVLSSGEFFVLEPGENNITFSAGISKVIVKPRWWII